MNGDHESRLGVVCAHCGCESTHQRRVDVWFRDEDDSADVRHVVMERGATTMDADGQGNPSARRDGLTITLECELCGKKTALDVWQHKGSTRVELRAIGV